MSVSKSKHLCTCVSLLVYIEESGHLAEKSTLPRLFAVFALDLAILVGDEIVVVAVEDEVGCFAYQGNIFTLYDETEMARCKFQPTNRDKLEIEQMRGMRMVD